MKWLAPILVVFALFTDPNGNTIYIAEGGCCGYRAGKGNL